MMLLHSIWVCTQGHWERNHRPGRWRGGSRNNLLHSDILFMFYIKQYRSFCLKIQAFHLDWALTNSKESHLRQTKNWYGDKTKNMNIACAGKKSMVHWIDRSKCHHKNIMCFKIAILCSTPILQQWVPIKVCYHHLFRTWKLNFLLR